MLTAMACLVICRINMVLFSTCIRPLSQSHVCKGVHFSLAKILSNVTVDWNEVIQ
jgi:hypothetical protein